LLAAAAAAALLWGVIALSERRAAFVSAVTHELRTPLTTFRMYSEMLSSGMVAGEAQQRQYLETLRVEADRLSHLVENVLAYARLERGRADPRRELVEAGQLLDRAWPRLADRAAQAEMELVAEADERVRALALTTDARIVEQILFNLVDNACKYAAGGSDTRIHVTLDSDASHVLWRVRDHGPGISPSAARRLFQPFSKSSEEAANSAPGVGLGLALCDRLARQLGGRLRHEPTPEAGTTFVLVLPRVR
jgi:signal transduction histidine kinase